MLSSSSATATSLSGSSSSPQSHFSSPHSTNSPVAAPVLSTSHLPHTYELPGCAASDSEQPVPFINANETSWSASLPPGPRSQSYMTNHQMQHFPMAPQSLNQTYDPAMSLLPGSSPLTGTTSNIHESPRFSQMPPPASFNPLYSGHRRSISSSSSPQQYLMATPSLTSISTSPSSSDDPAEGRTSQGSASSSLWQDSLVGSLVDQTSSYAPNPNFAIPLTYSPTQMGNHINLNSGYPSLLPADASLAWSGPNSTVDPMVQFRQRFVSNDEDTSHPSSSAASTFDLLDDSTIQAIHQRRRSSGGQWATAFNQMTLQDGSRIPVPPNMPNLSKPYAASQQAQQLDQKRPTFPLFTVPEGTGSKVPSLSDVKDLWKLFMSEPNIPGPTPVAMSETHNTFDTAEPGTAPRPLMGVRTLSKSNSMPDLNSPLLAGPTSSSFMNGTTPMPAGPQQSYIPMHESEQMGAISWADRVSPTWTNEIRHRQALFNMMPGVKMDKTSLSNPILAHDAVHLNGRPIAGVLQHSTALQQTLAPERTPSFGLPEPNTLTPLSTNIPKAPSKLSSSKARPGNKRLASQALVPEILKKGGYALWDEADEGSLADVEEDGDFHFPTAGRPHDGGEMFHLPDSGMTTTASPIVGGLHPAISGRNSLHISGRQVADHEATMPLSTWPLIPTPAALGMAGSDEMRAG